MFITEDYIKDNNFYEKCITQYKEAYDDPTKQIIILKSESNIESKEDMYVD